MAEATQAAATEAASLDTTPVNLIAQGNIPIAYLKRAGVNFSNAIWEEWEEHEGGVRIERGTQITVQKHVADELRKLQTSSIKPREKRKRIPAFVLARD